MTPSRPYDSRHWRRLRQQIIQRDGGCLSCGSQDELQVDHVKSWREGGAWYDPGNLRTLCRDCHNAKTWADRRRRKGERTAKPKPSTPLVRSRNWL